jgi:1,4-dihydroxy-2-naphthoate octaprenyltransferase
MPSFRKESLSFQSSQGYLKTRFSLFGVSSSALSLKHWLLAIRPKTLTAAVVPILAATALAGRHGGALYGVALCALVSALAIQIATNLINDYIDFEKGADTAERLGPTRVTQSGLFERRQVKWAAGLALLIAVLFGLPVVIEGGWPLLVVGLVSLFMAYSYTAGPWPLAYLGLGDLFVVLFFGLISVGGIYFLEAKTLTLDTVVLGLQIGLLAAVLIAINNLRDVVQDVKANKKTLAVRFGVQFVRAEIAALVLVPFALQLYWILNEGWIVGLVPFLTLPLGLKVIRAIYQTEPSRAYNQFLAQSAALHATFGLTLTLALGLAHA